MNTCTSTAALPTESTRTGLLAGSRPASEERLAPRGRNMPQKRKRASRKFPRSTPLSGVRSALRIGIE